MNSEMPLNATEIHFLVSEIQFLTPEIDSWTSEIYFLDSELRFLTPEIKYLSIKVSSTAPIPSLSGTLRLISAQESHAKTQTAFQPFTLPSHRKIQLHI
jgi:hypothetical protein